MQILYGIQSIAFLCLPLPVSFVPVLRKLKKIWTALLDKFRTTQDAKDDYRGAWKLLMDEEQWALSPLYIL